MDVDPGPVLAALTCPVLAYHGQTDEWMPLPESMDAWRVAVDHGALTDLTVLSLDGADRLPTRGGRPEPTAIVGEYSRSLVGRVDAHVRPPRGDRV